MFSLLVIKAIPKTQCRQNCHKVDDISQRQRGVKNLVFLYTPL